MMQLLLELAPYASLLVAIISFIGTLLLWMARKEFATNGAVQAAHKRADEAHHRLDVLEERLKGFPGYDVTNELRDDFAEMGKGQAAVATELRIIREQLQRMDDFLRNHK